MPSFEAPTTQNILAKGDRLRRGEINSGSLGEAFGTGLTGGLASITGNRQVADVQSNLDTSFGGGLAGDDVLSQAANPFLTQGQQNVLKRRRGLAAASGIFGNAVDAQAATGAQEFLARNRVSAIGSLQAQSASRFNAFSDVAGGAFDTLGGAFDPASALNFDAEEFRPLLQTLSDLGFGDEVNSVLAGEAGQLALAEGGNVDAEVFGAISNFINPQLTGAQQGLLQREARRLPARFIAPGESTFTVKNQRKDARMGMLQDQFLGRSRQASAGALTEIIGRRTQTLNQSAQQLQLQHSLAQSALQRRDFSAVLDADFSFANPLFQGTGLSAQAPGAAQRSTSLNTLSANRSAAAQRFAPQARERQTPTFRSF